MRKKCLVILLPVVAVLLIILYYFYDGAYVIETMTSTELELINEYATYKTPFSDKTIVEDFVLKDDIESYFYHHNQYIKATLLVPNDEIDAIFPEELRCYDTDMYFDLRKNDNEVVHFKIWMPRAVVKWPDKTSRNIQYNVLVSGNEYTKVYLSVDKLGWKLYNYERI
ncbi:MAG: hypothetical protein SPL89_08800 [Clostridia bacterium]|nr:hypothetical protein [Clostridia bacterium]